MNQQENEQSLKAEFGKYIKKHRKVKGWTQSQLAEKLGVTVKSVSFFERGLTFPSQDNIFKLAQILDMSLDEFVFGCSRFNSEISIDKINQLLNEMNPKEQGALMEILQTAAKSIRTVSK